MQRVSGRARIAMVVAALGVTASLVAGAATPNVQARTRSAGTSVSLTGGGSTFIFPLMSRWAFVYSHTVDKTVSINYQAIGSGAGISSWSKGLVDFAGTDAFLAPSQMTGPTADAIHLPMTIGPVAITYNLTNLSKPINLDGPTLALIFLGKITTWNDKAIAALNPGVSLPSTTIAVAHRADGSGTTFIFTNYLSAVSSDWKAGPGAATVVNWPVGTGAKGTAGVAAAVKQSPGGIGYVELSYALSNNLPVASIKNKAGNFVPPSVAGAAADAAGAGTLPADLRALIVNADGKDAYPITGFTWVLIHQKAPNADKYGALLKFLWWCVHQGQSYSQSGALRYAPLPSNIVSADEAKINSVTYNGKALFTGH